MIFSCGDGHCLSWFFLLLSPGGQHSGKISQRPLHGVGQNLAGHSQNGKVQVGVYPVSLNGLGGELASKIPCVDAQQQQTKALYGCASEAILGEAGGGTALFVVVVVLDVVCLFICITRLQSTPS